MMAPPAQQLALLQNGPIYSQSQYDAELATYDAQLKAIVAKVQVSVVDDEPDWYRNAGSSIVRILKNVDGLSMARSICVGLAEKKKRSHEFITEMILTNVGYQGFKARILLKNAGIVLNLPSYDMRHAQLIQEYLNRKSPSQYRLGIIAKDPKIRVLYRGPAAKQHILLLLHNGHYDYIRNPARLFDRQTDFCLDCGFCAKNNNYHYKKCEKLCQRCMRYGNDFPCRREPGQPLMECDKCSLAIETADCMAAHHIQCMRKKKVCNKKL
jgi:hypothetical protein